MKNQPHETLSCLLFATACSLSLGLLACAQAPAPAAAEKRPPAAVGFGGLGGGTGNINPDNMLMSLDEAVGLTPDQKIRARAILQKEADALNALAPAERFEKGLPFRQAGRDELRALLTPEQKRRQDALRKATQAQDAEERSFVTGILRSSRGISARLGAVSSLEFLSSSTDLGNDRRRGRFSYLVIGSTGSETLEVFWERKPAGGPVKIVKIEGADGTVIQP